MVKSSCPRYIHLDPGENIKCVEENPFPTALSGFGVKYKVSLT